MKNKILILLARLNFIFPNYLGYKYRKYGSFFKDNREKFDSLPLLLRTINYSKKSVPHYIKSNIKNIEGVKDFENNIPFIDKDVVMDYLYTKTAVDNYTLYAKGIGALETVAARLHEAVLFMSKISAAMQQELNEIINIVYTFQHYVNATKAVSKKDALGSLINRQEKTKKYLEDEIKEERKTR